MGDAMNQSYENIERLEEQEVEAAPALQVPGVPASAVSSALVHAWQTEREARKAAGMVAGFVGVPAIVAAGTVLVTVALASVVLLAPVIAIGLSWLAWRENRRLPAASRA